MLDLAFFETGPSLSQSALDALERSLDLELNREHRDLLLRHNGGVPALQVVDVPGLDDSPVLVHEFVGLGLEPESSNLDWVISTVGHRLPAQAVPLAWDGAGGVFFYCCGRSSIFFGDLNSVAFEAEGAKAPCYEVSRSLEAFLGQLRDFDDD